MWAWEEKRLASFKDGGHSQSCVRGRKRGWQVLKMAATVCHVCVGGNVTGKILRWRPLSATWVNEGRQDFKMAPSVSHVGGIIITWEEWRLARSSMFAPAHSGSCELQADLKHYLFVGFWVRLRCSY